MIAQCSGARPFPAHESKSPASMDINYHRKHDDHGHTQEINGPDLHQKLQSDLLPSDVSGKKAFKTVFTMLPKGPVPPSVPSPIYNSFPNAKPTQISTRSVSYQP